MPGHAGTHASRRRDDFVNGAFFSAGAIGNAVDDHLGCEFCGTRPGAQVGLLTLVPAAVGEGVFPAEMVEVGDGEGQKEEVGVHGSLEDLGDSWRAGDAGLGLVDLVWISKIFV